MSLVRRLIREEAAARDMSRAEARAILWTLIRLPPGERRRVLASMPDAAMRAIADEWWWQARGGQIEPPECADGRDWRIWALIAARGFGKTRAGAEWVQRARETPEARIALVADSMDEAARVMIEGESGLLAVARMRRETAVDREPGPARVRVRGAGLRLLGRSGRGGCAGPSIITPGATSSPNGGGPRRPGTICMLGLRPGTRPRVLVTTTPRPVEALRADPGGRRRLRADRQGRAATIRILREDFLR